MKFNPLTHKKVRPAMAGRALMALLALVVALLALPAQAKTYIVCIGLQDYPGTINDTHLCAKDAKTIQWLFNKNGAETKLLLNSDATSDNILAAMRKLFAKAGENDAVAIFYAGHGMPGVLCAYDGDLSYERVWQVFETSKAKRRFAFINACHSGTMRTEYDHSSLNGKNIMFFLSSRSSEYSLEILTMKNGLFTAYLQQGLRGSADTNRDRVITAQELFQYVSEGVKRRSNNQQHPVMWGRFPDDMPIMNW